MAAVRMHMDEFKQILAPAHARAMELEREVKDAERELENLIRAVDFDEEATEAAQRRLGDLNLALVRWGRRHKFLEGCFTGADAADYVEIEEA